jgi:hypothetical protein
LSHPYILQFKAIFKEWYIDVTDLPPHHHHHHHQRTVWDDIKKKTFLLIKIYWKNKVKGKRRAQ